MKSVMAALILLMSLQGYSQEKPLFRIHKLDGPVDFWYGPFSEACAVFDVNNDGIQDITSGAYWYEGPDFIRHPLREVGPPQNGEFINNGGEYPYDVNGDGWTDLISWEWFEDQNIYWYENNHAREGLWKKHLIAESKSTEFVQITDLDGDGDPDLIPSLWDLSKVRWIEMQPDTFVSHIIGSEEVRHGIGTGDINADGRTDIITSKGWYEMPANPRSTHWKWHPEFDLGDHTGFPVLLHDINGDGLEDLIYGNGHGYGLYWMEQQKKDKDRSWQRHAIDTTWSQVHALTLADIDGDGKKELITGKRLRGHKGKDPGSDEPLGIYWYDLDEMGSKCIKHVIAYNATVGTGMKINVTDMDGDGDPDIVVSGKSGLYLLENRTVSGK